MSWTNLTVVIQREKTQSKKEKQLKTYTESVLYSKHDIGNVLTTWCFEESKIVSFAADIHTTNIRCIFTITCDSKRDETMKSQIHMPKHDANLK